MPIGLDPSQTCPVWLDSDAAVPEETRPTFLVRFLTVRKYRELQKLVQEAIDAPRWEDEDRILSAACALAVAGWRNVVGADGAPLAFEADRIDDLLTPQEKWELARKSLTEPVSFQPKKSASASPSSQSTGSSATSAGADAGQSPS